MFLVMSFLFRFLLNYFFIFTQPVYAKNGSYEKYMAILNL